MTYLSIDNNLNHLPNPVKCQGRWVRGKDGTMYKSVWFWDGRIEWMREGTERVMGDYFGPTRTIILEYNWWEKFKNQIRGGVIDAE